MKDNINNNVELQLVLDSFAQALSEMREDISLIKSNTNPNNNSSPIDSPLMADLLNKIAETIDNAKKAIDEADLRKFINAVISVTTELQNRANKASAEFLNQKIAELQEIAKQPTIIENKYSIDFKSNKSWIVIVVLAVLFVTSGYMNYDQFQTNSQYVDNDLKYRYIKMRQGIDANTIFWLERIFNSSDSTHIVNKINVHVTDYEQRLKEKIQKEEQKERLEKEINNLKIK